MRNVPEAHVVVPAQRDQRSRPDAGGEVEELRGLMHDVGHGLATLALLMESVRTTGDDAARRESLLAMVEQETARLSSLLHHRGGRHGQAEPVMPVLQRVVTFADQCGPASVTLTGDPALPRLADPTLLWRIVSNLVDNATRAAGHGGTVQVHAGARPGTRDGLAPGLVVDGVDDGPGVGRGTSGVAGLGRGVGRRRVSSCGGPIDITAGSSGRGTRVRVTLPDAARARRAPGPAPRIVHSTVRTPALSAATVAVGATTVPDPGRG
ncbi:ATP-binding protein [Pseudonocardia sp.]|uniref:ATP-binding protein n=1 Tax=Pseudonocardia sp. TaxID=60912 RepID=UPI003D15158A